MLNISSQSVQKKVDLSNYKSAKLVSDKRYYRHFNRISLIFLVIILGVLFLPWTQNVTGKGYVTTLQPSQRPQTIQSTIPGRIEKWYIQEGAYVNKGDTILQLSEIKSEYFDDRLVERTGEQIESKRQSVQSYGGKSDALESQISAIQNERQMKLKQAQNKLQQAALKVKTNETDLEAARTNIQIAQTQYERAVALNQEGLKATKDVEEKKLKLQETQAKLVSNQNKLLESQNEVSNAEIELSRLNAYYDDKLAKTRSEIFATESNQFSTQAEVSKLENSYANYAKRKELLFVTAPQNGYINKALKGGVGENFKEGESLVSIMPADYQIAVETYIKPIDMPLIKTGERVRVQFDGWPAIVFSGWENVSYGTYGAIVVATENNISENGMYRVLLAPDKDDHKWPNGIRIGSGAKTIALLNDVPIWYEIWRRLNGFPPNFYNSSNSKNTSKSK